MRWTSRNTSILRRHRITDCLDRNYKKPTQKNSKQLHLNWQKCKFKNYKRKSWLWFSSKNFQSMILWLIKSTRKSIPVERWNLVDKENSFFSLMSPKINHLKTKVSLENLYLKFRKLKKTRISKSTMKLSFSGIYRKHRIWLLLLKAMLKGYRRHLRNRSRIFLRNQQVWKLLWIQRNHSKSKEK